MHQITAKQLFVTAGPVMIPIVICSVSALTIMIKKWRDFNTMNTGAERLKQDVFVLIKDNKIKSAVALCETNFSADARVLKAGLLKFGCPREEIKEAVENSTALEIPKLEKGLVALITIANVSPLLGIFGTILGITMIFAALENQTTGMTVLTATNLSQALWQALLTTLAGLLVAIPSFVAYNYFIDCVNHKANQLRAVSIQLVDLLTRAHESTNSQIADLIE